MERHHSCRLPDHARLRGRPRIADPAPARKPPPPSSAYNPADIEAMEHAYTGAPADAVDRGQMTYDDVIIKTAISLGAVILGAALGWFLFALNPAFGLAAMAVGFLGGFVLAMVNIFSRTIRPALVLAYALVEGLALGALSAVMELAYPGVVIQALLATAAVFTVTLVLFSSGKVRNSPKLMRFMLIGMVGLIVYRLLNMVLVWTGVLSTSVDNMRIMGIPLGLAVGVFAVILGAISLIGDFDQIQQGVRAGAPAKFAWACAFGLMVTIIWMYTEMLRLLAILRD
ncbi:Bax inhibitor-1/YccA family protein [Schaalia sp. Marseille-Q2122]|uniref:Bax inhibitor-1/YccA family protein n=1 Tax=Schaalia sp. Marseille-Q2122 TaxID=2736604 RepID=UPI0020CA7C07|nr:Bax inhibitor-1/YccA family protein [Schaalia sp. Marseille-Q2122]